MVTERIKVSKKMEEMYDVPWGTKKAAAILLHPNCVHIISVFSFHDSDRDSSEWKSMEFTLGILVCSRSSSYINCLLLVPEYIFQKRQDNPTMVDFDAVSM